jgi:hypothetical protein
MVDDPFLIRIHARRRELQKELADLDTAERVYKGIGPKTGEFPFVEAASEPQQQTAPASPRPSIKEMILIVLGEAGTQGCTSKGVLQAIQVKWLPDFKKQNLYPKLSFFKGKEWVALEDGNWKLTDEGRKELLPS